MSRFRRRQMLAAAVPGGGGGYIVFADPEVEAICVQNWGDGVGITPAQAAAVTSIGQTFRSSSIVTFDELKYFTSVIDIGIAAFLGCSSLQSLDISNIQSIGSQVWTSVTSLSKLLIQSIEQYLSISPIGDYPFGSSTAPSRGLYVAGTLVEDVIIPPSITSTQVFFRNVNTIKSVSGMGIVDVANYAFYGCSGLETADFGENISNIGLVAFYGTSLRTITVRSQTPPTLGSQAFLGCPLSNIYVPASAVEAYKAAPGWSDFASIIQAIPTA